MKIIKFLALTLLFLLVFAFILLFEGDTPVDVVDAKYSNESSQFLTLPDDSVLHYRDQGSRRGPALILIHGFGASLHTWMPWVERLESDYRLVTLDLPAHGLTGRVQGNDYTMPYLVGVVDNLVRELRLEEFVIGGNSMGGLLAWEYTLRHPSKVTAVILLDASGLPEWGNEGAEPPVVFKLLEQAWFRTVAANLDPYLLIAQAVRSAYNYSGVVNDDLIMRYYHLTMREGTRSAIIDLSAQLQTERTEVELSQLDQPTLILWGALDSLVDAGIGRHFHRVLPNSTLKIYEDVGHIPMEEIPDRTVADLRSFMESL